MITSKQKLQYSHKQFAMDTQEKALRYNDGKLRWSLVHFTSLRPMVRVLEFGAVKYAVANWQKGLNRRDILESLIRHATDLLDGQELDPDSGLHHIGHIMCNAMFYQYFVDHPEKEVPQKEFQQLKKET